jgi:hypothetical protein
MPAETPVSLILSLHLSAIRIYRSLRIALITMASYNEEEKESMYGYVLKVSGPCKFQLYCESRSSGRCQSYVWYQYVRIGPCRI